MPSTSATWKPRGTAESVVNLSCICCGVSDTTLSSASKASCIVASLCASSFRRLDAVAVAAERRGLADGEERYAGALWKTDCTASLFRYLHLSFELVNFFRRLELLS